MMERCGSVGRRAAVSVALVMAATGGVLAPVAAGAPPIAETPAYCTVLAQAGVDVAIDANVSTWPVEGTIMCRGHDNASGIDLWLTPFPTVVGAQAAVDAGSTSWRTPEWIDGFERAVGGGGENLPEGGQHKQNWYFFFARSNFFVSMHSTWVIRSESGPLDATSEAALAVIGAARQLDAALQNPLAYGLPTGDAPVATTLAPTTTVASMTSVALPSTASTNAADDPFTAFGDATFTQAELTSIANDKWPKPWSEEVKASIRSAAGEWIGNEMLEDVLETSLSAEQLQVLSTLNGAVFLAGLEPRSFPGLQAMLPVINRLAATAIGPPYDASAALAVTRLVRMTVALELQNAIPRDKPTEVAS